MTAAIFLDKDGTLVENVPYNVDPAKIRLATGAGEALRMWAKAGYSLVVVSNQSGVARGLFPFSALDGVRVALADLLFQEGVSLAGCYFCPHHEQGWVASFAVDCPCRKPRPGMLQKAAEELGLSLESSWMVGDILDDVEAGHRAGCRSILLDSGGETEWRLDGSLRRPDYVASDLISAARFSIGRTFRCRQEETVHG